MQKLFRFSLLSVLFVVMFCFLYCLIPSAVWILGGSFKNVAHDWTYGVIMTLIIVALLCCLFAYCFDEDFYEK